MKATASGAASLALVSAMIQVAQAVGTNPVTKALELLSDLQTKVISEGEEATKTYNSFAEWCEERSKALGFEIKTDKAEMTDIQATIEAQTATFGSLTTKVEELAASTATAEANLKAATAIRAKEAADFAAEQQELGETIDTLERAVGILEREMQKGGASALQLKGAGDLARTLGVLVDASALTSADARQLTALVQASHQSEGGDAEADASLGAPDAAAYEGHSTGIISTLEDLLEKAQGQLSDVRQKETSSLHSFEMVKQSLEDEIKFASKEMAEAKQKAAASSEAKATAEGDLEVTSGELKEDTKALSELHHDCMGKAQDFEVATKERDEELKAIAAAKQVIKEKTGGAEAMTYGLNQVALVQLSRAGTRSAGFRAVRLVRELARSERSPALAQLAVRMAAATRVGAGDDPFAKVKGLISDMLDKLESEAEAEASQKAYCDKEMAEAKAKKEDKTTAIEKLSTKIDQQSSRTVELKSQIAALEKGLSDLAKSQAESDKLRSAEKADFVKSEADMKLGVDGVKLALKVLRDYYGKASGSGAAAADGAGAGIIGLLEVVESDFSKGLAEMRAAELTAKAEYDQETKENSIERATKEKDVKYKAKEVAELEKAVAEAESDRSVEQSELDAVMDTLKTLEKQCVAQPMSFEERQARFAKELAGLKEALSILGGEAVLLQRGARHALRGVRAHRGAA